MHLNKLAILLIAAATPTVFSQKGGHQVQEKIAPEIVFSKADKKKDPDKDTSLTKTNCYASTSLLMPSQQGKVKPVHHSSPAANPSLLRKLGKTETTVIDYKEGSWTLLRDEVVNAVQEVIDGAQAHFQLNLMMGDTLQVFLIEQDDMIVSTNDLDGEFTLVNAFFRDRPYEVYQVDCPASGDGDICTVKRVNRQDEDGNDLVTCLTEESIITKEDIPAECGKEMYDMALYALPGPHFILAGTKSLDLDPSSTNTICPKSIAFSSDGGRKGKRIVSPYMEDFKNLPKYALGVAALDDVLKAEENAEGIDYASYDLLTNNCVNYASRIWRHLEFDETEDLANFLVHNIIVDEAQLEKWASKHGGRKLYKTMLNKGLEEFWKNVVYSQARFTLN